MTNPVSVGVALSSGGAAGLAHVGALEVLEEAGIAIEHVAGTSAGAMVGAAFAADQLAGLRDRFCALSRRQVMQLFDPTWAGGGLFGGRRAIALIRPFIGELIEDLPRRFAAVATNLSNGTREVIKSGPVAEAIRASAAIPGLFTPVRRNGRLLVDGALVDPIPVEAVRELGATFVIAISVIPPSIPPDDEPHTVTDVLTRASVVVQSQVAAARLREQGPDFLIQPDVCSVGVFDFHIANNTVEAGRAAARAALPALVEAIQAVSASRPTVLRRLIGGGEAA